MTNTAFSKKTWMKVHTYLSLFFLPLAFIYAITGVGYIFDLRQDAGARVFELPLDSAPAQGTEQAVLLELLKTHNLRVPPNTEVKFIKGNPSIGNVAYSATISKGKDGKPTFRVVERSWYGVLLLMHKSSGSKFELGSLKLSVFDFLAIGFGASLLLFYLSGLIATSFCKRDRLASFSVLGLGVVATLYAIYLSV